MLIDVCKGEIKIKSLGSAAAKSIGAEKNKKGHFLQARGGDTPTTQDL